MAISSMYSSKSVKWGNDLLHEGIMYHIKLTAEDGRVFYWHTRLLSAARYLRNEFNGTIVGWPYP